MHVDVELLADGAPVEEVELAVEGVGTVSLIDVFDSVTDGVDRDTEGDRDPATL